MVYTINENNKTVLNKNEALRPVSKCELIFIFNKITHPQTLQNGIRQG